MGLTDSTLKKLKATMQLAQEKTVGKEKEVSDVCSAAEKLVLQTAVQRILEEQGKKTSNSFFKQLLGVPCKLGGMAVRWNLMTGLAGAIDRLLEENPASAAEQETVQEEPVYAEENSAEPEQQQELPEAAAQGSVEEAVPEEAEPAVEAFAEMAPEDAEEEQDEDTGDEDDEEEAYDGIDLSELEFIDVMEQPERYQTMLEQECRGEVRLVSRYRRSYLSRLIQSQGNVQEYYSVIKNALLSYKGVKERVSWNYESFNKGRTKVAKINAKTRTLYLYLAINPEELQDTKYFFDDMSSKKKYAEVPVLLKIRGERKLKHALELIDKLCSEQLALPPVKAFEPTDYTVPYQATSELVQAGQIKQFTAAVPVEVTAEISFF